MASTRTPSSSLVLIVDDEDLVRMMATDMLEDAGFTVLEAASADEALEILENRSDIGLLFTDMEMPGSMNGFALAARVAERWPHIRLMITSGRCRPAPRDVPDHGMFVPKPYLVEQVLNAFDKAGPV
ncbi:response regulator [Methylorubrum podarium]|uniref:Response regulator n=1 Tax=Methylorubrum podarium TaxID=200476 RepID=A0ABV1QRM6_9HYPH